MRTMALAESQRSSAVISLGELFNGQESVSGKSPLSYEALADEAVRGGWPALLESPVDQAVEFNRAYCEDLYRTHIPDATGARHQPERLRRVFASLARNLSTEASINALAADVGADGPSIDARTVRSYLDAFAAVFAIEPLPAWSVNLRSRSRVRQLAKLQLADPSLACAALGVDPARLARDPEYFGFVFEAMAVRDLRVYAEQDGGRVYHYRDNTGLEVDTVIERPDGQWAGIEVKLGGRAVEVGERNLLKLRDGRVAEDRAGAAAFLAVLTGTEYAYTLPSGVHVIPLATLAA